MPFPVVRAIDRDLRGPSRSCPWLDVLIRGILRICEGTEKTEDCIRAWGQCLVAEFIIRHHSRID